MTEPRTPRDRARAAFTADLLDVARRQMAEHGAAALSLRAVARELGVASSAVYRYVDSRDALLTLLIIEAYDAAGEACETALAAARAAGLDSGRTWLAVARAFRSWARENRHAFALVYGTPVPGYAAPQDTTGHATRVWAVLGTMLAEATARGELGDRLPAADVRGLITPQIGRIAAEIVPAEVRAGVDPDDAVVRSVVLFSTLVGAVTAELFGHLHTMSTDDARLVDVVLAAAGVGAGLDVALD